MFKLKLVYLSLTCFLLLALNLQCKKSTDSNTTELIDNTTATKTITAKDFEQLKYVEYALSDSAAAKTKNWLKFQNLRLHIDQLKKGDFYFFKEDKAILTGFITDLKKEIPSTLNTEDIAVRLRVIETMSFKLEEVSNINVISKETLLKSITDVLIAYNNLIFQINKKVEKDALNIEKPM